MERSVCWNITTRCNENCKFCFRFLDKDELSFEDNKKILSALIKMNVKKITWTGGECLLYPYLFDLMKLAHQAGIENVLISNARLLDKDKIDNIKGFVDCITFSIDSSNDDINEQMGRGKEHYPHVIDLMDYIKTTPINLRVNSLVSKPNLNELGTIARVIDRYNVERWKLFKFVPLRGKAVGADKAFSISDEEFLKATAIAQKNAPNTNVLVCVDFNLEGDYLLITPSGEFIVTKDREDKKICDYQNMDIEKLEDVLRS